MKHYYHTAYGIIGGILLSTLAACEDKPADTSKKGVAVTVRSEIVAMAGAHSSGSSWNADDAIGVFMVKAGKGIVVNRASNQQFVTSGDGVFVPVQGRVTFPVSGEKVDLFSYAPYRDLVYDFIYPISLGDQQEVPVMPLLYAERVRDRDATTPRVEFSFRHQLAKLVMNVSAGEGISDLEGLSIRLQGMNTEAEFDLLAGTLGIKPSVAEITPTRIDEDTFCALLLPTESDLTQDQVVDFTIPGNTYTWYLMEEVPRIEKAKIYEFDIAVDRAGIRVTGSVRDWVDTDWEDVSAGNR